MKNTTMNTGAASLSDEQPTYIFLAPGDVIRATDERYSATYHRWKPIAPLYVGTTVDASTRPVRRAAIAAGGAQEAIYQVMVGEKWVDSTAAEYAAVSNEKRIVYAAPLPRVAATVPLTDEQIFDIKRGSIGFGPITGPDIPKFARALLAASNGEQEVQS